MEVTIDVTVNEKSIQDKIQSLLDDVAMTEIHKALADIVEPYSPINPTRIDENGVTYEYPYAHYMYEGIVYKPNIPIVKEGEVVGWFSPPNQKKTPSDQPMQYSKPLASRHWDEVAMSTHQKEFEEKVKDILVRRAKELYG